jgi:hypothetical protein
MDEIIYIDFQEHHYNVAEMTDEQKADLQQYSPEIYDSLFGQIVEPVENPVPPFAV